MEVTTSKVIRLTFTTAGSKTFVITLPDPRENLQPAEAAAVMEGIIASNLYLPASGALTGIKDIRVIETTISDLYDQQQA
jgi:hypothetical protein